MRIVVSLFSMLLFVSTGAGHYHMLLPAAAYAKHGQTVPILFQWGHPFEHQLFSASAPQSLFVILPDGKMRDLTKKLSRIQLATGKKKVTAFRLGFTPDQRGDFVFILKTLPIWIEEEKVYFQDTVKVILHVQVQEGWDNSAKQDFEMMPLTRPYGLEAGMVFQVQVVSSGKPLRGGMIEIERYNAVPPKELPAEEQITRTAKTDPNGVVTCTLPDRGWWGLTAIRDAGKRRHQGKAYPIRQRTTIWVHVDEKSKIKR